MIKEKIVLASASPRRKELIRYIGENVIVRAVDCDETIPHNMSARETVEYLSKIKNDAAREISEENELVVSADTIVVAEDEILGKPADKEDARRMMHLLSGKAHCVYTGVTISQKGKVKTFSEKTEVMFYPMSEAEIEEYISDSDIYDKAGAYGIQSGAAVFIKGINGDYYNVVGLPVARLKREIENFIEL